MNKSTTKEEKPKNCHAGHRQRMYDKISAMRYLHDHEVLEMFLFPCRPRVNTNDIAHRLLDTFGDVDGVLEADIEELCLVEGIGRETAMHIALSCELFRRKEINMSKHAKLSNEKEIKDFVCSRFQNIKNETLEIYFLDRYNRVKTIKAFTDFSMDKVTVAPTEYVQLLATYKPFAVILVHNHPSGNEMPSKADDKSLHIFDEITAMGGSLLADNLIYADGKVFSYCFQKQFHGKYIKTN